MNFDQIIKTAAAVKIHVIKTSVIKCEDMEIHVSELLVELNAMPGGARAGISVQV